MWAHRFKGLYPFSGCIIKQRNKLRAPFVVLFDRRDIRQLADSNNTTNGARNHHILTLLRFNVIIKKEIKKRPFRCERKKRLVPFGRERLAKAKCLPFGRDASSLAGQYYLL